MKKTRNLLSVVLCASLMLVLSCMTWFKPATIYSDSERRALKQFPNLTLETVFSGKFTSEFESYTQDQFPLRDAFRTIKALANSYLFQRLDNNDVYLKDGYLSKIEYPLNDAMMDNALNKFDSLYKMYLQETDVNLYFSIVPDKNYVLAGNDVLKMDYDRLFETMKTGMNQFQYVDVVPLLSLDDYYYTDTHWRQEKIVDVAETLLAAMGNTYQSEYQMNRLDVPFYGVFHGQSALPLQPDTIQYLTNDVLESCIVTSFATGKGKEIPLYDFDKAAGKDAYEMFLNGADPLVMIENPNSKTEKELVIFRDSFGSSLAPLLVENYAKVTLVDIRYLQSNMLGNFIEFNDQDVLFIYSTLILNSSTVFN